MKENIAEKMVKTMRLTQRLSDTFYLASNILLMTIFFLSFTFNRDEYVATIILATITIVTFLSKYYKGEWILYVTGVVLGIVIELGGNQIYKLQYWIDGSFYGMPLWLPLLWGFTFILINRLGKLVVA